MRIASNLLDEMIAEATVDCYNDAEMATALLVAIQEHVVFPFHAEVLGVAVQVTAVDINAAGAIVAVCKSGPNGSPPIAVGRRTGSLRRSPRPACHQNRRGGVVSSRPGEIIPKSMKPVYDEIVRMTDAFCDEHLDGDYAGLCAKMAAHLSRKRPSPLSSGQTRSWAGAILYTLGRTNFLFDTSQRPHMTSAQLCFRAGVSIQTATSKARLIERALKIEPLDPRWCVPSILEQNPLAWMIVIDGFMIDARDAPREIQEVAFRKGLIPFVPEPSP